MDRSSELENPSPVDTLAILAARVFAYDLLKCFFLREPSEALLKLLIENELVQAFPFRGDEDDLSRAADTMLQYLKQPETGTPEGFQRLHWDYTRLFVGPGKVPAPPYESMYRDTERLHFSEETLDVRDAYRRYGLLPGCFGREPDDHLGLELDFMHTLAEMTREKAEQGDESGLAGILGDQMRFLDDHLLKWVPAWAEDVAKSAETDFYRGAARLVEAFIQLDRELIDTLIER